MNVMIVYFAVRIAFVGYSGGGLERGIAWVMYLDIVLDGGMRVEGGGWRGG